MAKTVVAKKMGSQSTNRIAMVRPAAFQFNSETAKSNTFQRKPEQGPEPLLSKVLAEFDQMVQLLRGNGIELSLLQDTPYPVKPDALFPNNWISFHAGGEIVLYPMLAANRRLERKPYLIEELCQNRTVSKTVDLSHFEVQNQYLEGTGSLILDRKRKWAFAALSPRTSPIVFEAFIQALGYKGISFRSEDTEGKAIYHTNVMMALGTSFAVLAEDNIPNQQERKHIRRTLQELGKEVLLISPDQVNDFCGNIIELKDKDGQSIIVLSERAHRAFNQEQLNQLSRFGSLLPIAIPTIEAVGGGSVRCMILELF